MNNKFATLLAAGCIASVAVTACHSSHRATGDKPQATDVQVSQAQAPSAGERKSYIPRAVIYKTNTDADDRVGIMMAEDGKTILSYPDPRDITEASRPLPLIDGWLLDRRGCIGENTAFLSLTYDEYETLPSVLTPEELRNAIVRYFYVTKAVRLPISHSQAAADTAAVNDIIRQGLKDCTTFVNRQ